MSKNSASVKFHPHQEHLLIIETLIERSRRPHPPSVRREAKRELQRYRDQGLILQKFGKDIMATKGKLSPKPPKPDAFTGQGIIFAIIDDREQISTGTDRRGRVTTIDVFADAIEAALDRGHETSEEIARYVLTSAFQHEPDRRVKYNSMLAAGDRVGAYLLHKLYNSIDELAELAEEETDPQQKKLLLAEAHGFALALTIMLSPFSSEDKKNPRLVDWDEVDRMADALEKERRFYRKEKKAKK